MRNSSESDSKEEKKQLEEKKNENRIASFWNPIKILRILQWQNTEEGCHEGGGRLREKVWKRKRETERQSKKKTKKKKLSSRERRKESLEKLSFLWS